ncbi:hypothetical protein EDC04DRAFT_2871063 [Pisolithus marmoratus]|nr:hypothetical protein EDC04DRAFT_2871063 [Pisolithus marmoratus]
MAPEKSFAAAVDSICTILSARPPYCSGTYPLSLEQLTLFYGSDSSNVNALFGDLSKISLSAKSTPQDLDKLAAACQPATFGVNSEDVYDESYRKAVKMDPAEFAASFDVEDSGLVDIGVDEKREIKMELYKLNVYGKDSFFKAHKDTPRGETMFGSLVVVYPTPHEGGEFVLRENDHEWVVDFARSISESSQQPCVGYISFFSDVEHEVRMVTSGHRVTLTYNLYFVTETGVAVPTISTPTLYDQALAEALYELMTNDYVLPYGGYLGIGLRRQYPVTDGTDVTNFRNYLKGPDAVLGRVFVRVFYREVDDQEYLHTRVVDLSKWGQMTDDVVQTIMRRSGAEVVDYRSIDGRRKEQDRSFDDLEESPVHLAEVTDLVGGPSGRSRLYVTYGNQPMIGTMYVDLCIIVDLRSPGRRPIHRPV